MDGAIWNAWIEGVKGLSGGRGLSELLPIEGVAKGRSSGGVVKGGAIMNDWSEGVKELSEVSELLPIH